MKVFGTIVLALLSMLFYARAYASDPWNHQYDTVAIKLNERYTRIGQSANLLTSRHGLSLRAKKTSFQTVIAESTRHIEWHGFDITARSGSVLTYMIGRDTFCVFNVHDDHSNSVVARYENEQLFEVSPGSFLLVAAKSQDVDSRDLPGMRRLVSSRVGTYQIWTGEYSISSLLSNPQLKSEFKSGREPILGKILKTAAAINTVFSRSEPFRPFVK
jgi:hypothetical protein